MRTAVQIMYDDGTVQVIPPAVIVPPPIVNPDPITSIIRGGYFDGIADLVAPAVANAFGMNWTRIWHGVSDWTKPPASDHPTFQRARLLKSLGMNVLLVVTPIEKGNNASSLPLLPNNSSLVYNFFLSMAAAANKCIDAWEVLNEPNLQNYNAGYNALASTVIYVQRPAFKALKEQSQFVVAGAPQEGATTLPYMIDSGLLDAGDAIAYHPYGGSVAQQTDRVVNVAKQVKGKPIWITEWNFHGPTDRKAWADMLVPGAKAIRPYVAAVFYFRMMRTTQAAGPAAPFYDDGGTLTPAAGFNQAAIDAMKVFA